MPVKNEKRAAQETIWEYRKEHSRSDLELIRETALKIINSSFLCRKCGGPIGPPDCRSMIEASKLLARTHGGLAPEKAPTRESAGKNEKKEKAPLSDEWLAKIDALTSCPPK